MREVTFQDYVSMVHYLEYRLRPHYHDIDGTALSKYCCQLMKGTSWIVSDNLLVRFDILELVIKKGERWAS